MLKSEQGFSLIETLISLSILLVIVITCMPLFTQILFQTSTEKKELLATRLLRDFVAITEIEQIPIHQEILSRGIVFQLNMEFNAKGDVYACAYYEETEKCIQSAGGIYPD